MQKLVPLDKAEKAQIDAYIKEKKDMFNGLIIGMDMAVERDNFDSAIGVMNDFALKFGTELKCVDFNDFKKMMKSSGDLVL